LPLIFQIGLYLLFVFEVEGDRSVNPDQGTGHGKGSENPFRRFAVLECMNNDVERNPRPSKLVAAVTLFHIRMHVSELHRPVYYKAKRLTLEESNRKISSRMVGARGFDPPPPAP
jgi:hypothetical protein